MSRPTFLGGGALHTSVIAPPLIQLALAKRKFAYKFEFLRSRYGT